VGVCAALFFVGVLGCTVSAKIGLYAISLWLNAWTIVFLLPQNKGLSKLDLYHDALVVWMLSYMLTNALWEIPWVLFSPFVFENLHTLDDVVAHTDFMRESVLHMYWWVLASFSSVDLRTVNQNSTFYTLELYAFVNVAAVRDTLRVDKYPISHGFSGKDRSGSNDGALRSLPQEANEVGSLGVWRVSPGASTTVATVSETS